MKHIAWLVVALVGCTDFESITRGICGNGLLEAGEDCDSSDASCVSCAITCSDTAPCPDGYACGVDGVCHAPGGAVGQGTSAGAFQANELRITDIDGDSIGDAFGLTRTSVVVRYGDEAGQLDALQSVVTPTQTGPAAFGDTDGDGTLDIAITTLDGLVTYASRFGELAPVPVIERVAGMNNERLDLRQFFYVTSNVFFGLVVDPATDATVLVSADPIADPPVEMFKYVLPCSARIGAIPGSQLSTAKIDMYNVSKRQDGVIDAVLGITIGTGDDRKMCMLSVHRPAPNLLNKALAFEFADITPALSTVPTADPVLADMDFDSDPCPGLVNPDPGLSAMQYWDGEMVSSPSGPKCTFKPAGLGNPSSLPAMAEAPPPGTKVLGRAPVDPKVFLVASDALITNEGVYVSVDLLVFKTLINTFPSSRTISEFGHGDVNGDGAIDLVFSSQGQDDIDVLFRVGNEAGFNFYRIDTTTAVSKLVVGDFDGNFHEDVAFTEVLDDYERLLVSFGTPDWPTEPAPVGTFDEVIEINRISIADSVDTLAVAEDLIVFQPPPAGKPDRRSTFLHGSPQRTLLSYLDPRSDADREATVFRGAVIGHFQASMGNEQYTDAVALAPANKRNNTVDLDTVKAWRMPGTPDGLDGATTMGASVTGVADCSLVGTTGGLCLDIARYAAFPTATDNRDVIVGVERAKRAVMIDPWNPGALAGTKLDALTMLMPMESVPSSLHVVDLDGDGSAELLAAFRPLPDKNERGAIITCTMVNGVPQSCTDIAPAIEQAAQAALIPIEHCYEVAAGRMSFRDRTTQADASLDLVVACRGEGTTIFRVRNYADEPEVVRLVNVPAVVSGLQIGDVTGDGVDDLVVLEGDVSRSLLVYPQCTNRELTCLQ